MNREAVFELAALEERHWWFRARRAAIRPHVDEALARARGGALLDVGCGTGANLAWLAARVPASGPGPTPGSRPAGPSRLVGIEPDPLALSLTAARGLDARLVRADAARLPLAAGSADLALSCDVLEHLEDDAAACRELARVLAPGGVLVATVPAGPGLWSVHDEALGHRRRYAQGELESRLAAAGFELEACHGFLCAPWPLIWLVRRLRRGRADAPTTDFTSPPRPIDALLGGAFSAEAALLRAFSIRRGVSRVIRARRR